MAKTLQRTAAPAAAAVAPTPALTNPDTESCDRLLRSPSATLADADEIAAASMGAGFNEALIKRQGIIIPGEFDKTTTADTSVTSPEPINEAQATTASASDDWLPPTPADSSPPTARSVSEDGRQTVNRRSQESRRRSSSTASTSVSASASEQVAHYEALMLRAQEQRNVAMAEATALQQQMEELQRASGSEIAQLRVELEAATRKVRIEYELRTAAETKCALMECELAELSSNIQYEAQNLVAVERREHRAEVDRMARSHAEVLQLMEMERAQVASLKLSLETVNVALDRERAEADRLRSGMVAFERQVSTLIAPVSPTDASSSSGALPPLSVRSFSASMLSSSSSGRLGRSAPQSLDSAVMAASSAAAVAPMVPEPHIVGSLFFGNDATRPDTRLAEFLGFINVTSDKEAQSCAFMQRSMREDVGPTLVADSASLSAGMPSLSAWSKGRRLVHGVQENTLILESFSPRMQLSRVLSLGCYLCGSSISRPLSSALSSLSMPMSPPPSSASSSLSTSEQRVQSLSGNGEGSGRGRCEMYRMRFNDNDEDNKPLCHHCHARMVAVCSFFAYLKIVRKGLIKRPIADIWLEVNKARLQMWLARSGASPDSRVAIAMT
ncbi:RAB3A interacting protein [Coemansia sp. IMI 209128]|nr:RAB3A interacting protein [Coemansia sp. IMI 209128]